MAFLLPIVGYSCGKGKQIFPICQIITCLFVEASMMVAASLLAVAASNGALQFCPTGLGVLCCLGVIASVVFPLVVGIVVNLLPCCNTLI